MIYTSYFAKYKNNEGGVSVARGMPKWFKGEQIIELAPPWDMIRRKEIVESEWTEEYYTRVLSPLNAQDIVKRCEGKVLLCWEKTGEFCHRRIVARWIERETGIIVPEYEPQETLFTDK